MSIESGDFFQALPRGDAYLLSHIIHDWDAERAIAGGTDYPRVGKACRRKETRRLMG